MGRPAGSKNKATIKKEEKAIRDAAKFKVSCGCCGKEKDSSEFYTATGTKFWIHSRRKAPLCKTCINVIFDDCVDKYGKQNATIMVCAVLDIPFIPAVYQSMKEKLGDKYTIGRYSRTLNVPQYNKMNFIDSVISGEIFKSEDEVKEEREAKWTRAAQRNRNYVIRTVGYDPFEDLPQNDRIDGYRILSGYLDISGVKDDTHKTLSAITITNSHLQIKRYDEIINSMVISETFAESKLKEVETARKSTLDALNRTAKENGFASQNDRDLQSKNTFTGKIKELQENDFEAIKVNIFDIETSAAMKQMMDLSHASIVNSLDDNDFGDIIKSQREMIQNQKAEIDSLQEELRLAKNTIIAAKKKV